MPDRKTKIVIIAGPTGVGKTSTTLNLAQHFSGEIISADAVSVYRYMDIGSAKPTIEERAVVPHHLIDVVNPDEPYDAARFASEAGKIIQRLAKNRQVPLIAGGTGFYIKSLLYGLFDKGVGDETIREQLKTEANRDGAHKLYERLLKCDPEIARRIHPNDTYRVVRALEIFLATGIPMSAHQKQHGFAQMVYDPLIFCLTMDRDKLYKRINHRVELMMDAGFEQEVRMLLSKGYGPELKSMGSLGYRHIAGYVMGQTSYQDAIETMKRDTRRFAKRQYTWFGKMAQVQWIDMDKSASLLSAVEKHIKNN